MYKAMTAVAALMMFAGAAQADTVKQIWNQEISEENPGRVVSASECKLDESSAFGCWNEHDEFDAPESVGPVDEPDEELPPTGQNPT